MKHTMQHDWNELDKALRELFEVAFIESILKPVMMWINKWITKISLSFSCLVDYVRMSISAKRECDKIEDVCAALEKLAEAKTQKLKELKKKVKTPQERR